MGNLTQKEFYLALCDKFSAEELVELLGLETFDIINVFEDLIQEKQTQLEDELKYGH